MSRTEGRRPPCK